MEEQTAIDVIYVSCACNRIPHCLDWGKNNLICYGARNAVAIYDTKFAGGGKVVQTLCHHGDLVNAVQWVRRSDGGPETELVSASADSTAVVWTRAAGSGRFAPGHALEGHQGSVLLVDAVRAENGETIVATASVDSSLRVWRILGKEVFCVQTITLGRGLCLSLRLNSLPGTGVLFLAYGTDDARIHLLAENDPQAAGGDCDDTGSGASPKRFVEVGILAGHEDWVRALDFVTDDNGDLLLASAAQDNMIRLWRVSPRPTDTTGTSVKTGILQTEEKKFAVRVDCEDLWFSFSLESVLSGHDGWVYGVAWFPRVHSGGGDNAGMVTAPLQLLSSSMDKTMVLWQMDARSGVWLESARLGEVGGNTLGFYGGKVSPDGRSVIGHGYQGSLHMWRLSDDGLGSWVPGVVVGGHFGPVIDLCWEPGGQYLLTAAADQTTRLHAPWVREDGSVTWHEMARPQVHGFDMSSLAALSRNAFASGAEEKVVRAFRAPGDFLCNFRRLCGLVDDPAERAPSATEPRGASVPALGLSNKAVYESPEVPADDRHVKEEFPEASFVPVELTEPPTEETLLQNTLWPEVQKLYGHGYELYSLAARPDGKVLASACRATTAEHAAILIWDTSSWQCVDRLMSHQLTVTQLAFSPDGNYLLSVSRDRRWSLFRLQSQGNRYQLSAATDKRTAVHSRIVWCCAWTPDSRFFATGSRDGVVAVWSSCQDAGAVRPSGEPLRLGNQSVTALSFRQAPGDYVLAVGLDCGDISLYAWLPVGAWRNLLHMDNSVSHHMTVKRLMFRPVSASSSDVVKDGGDNSYLASCGSDNAVRIYSIHLPTKSLLHT